MAVILLASLAGAGWFAIQRGWLSTDQLGIEIPEAIQPKPEVRLAIVSRQAGRSADATVVATGYLESRRQARIGARATGRIEEVFVEEGSEVKENDILAVLEHADLEAALAATRATAARAKAEIGEHRISIANRKLSFERAKDLRERNTISEAEFEAADFDYQSAVARLTTLEAAYELALARINEAEQMKENMFVRAPFDGTVISKDGEVGESILPGGMGEGSGRGSVVTIADLQHLEVDCDVKEDYISRVRAGQAAEVGVDAVPDVRYAAQVRKIIPMGDRARATIKVKVEILNADSKLFPDMSATVYFLPDKEAGSDVDESTPRVFCEEKAVQTVDEQQFVWLLNENDRVSRHEVSVGTTKDGRAEILEGLGGGERVVVASEDLREGQAVKLVQ